jgi:anaerobic selenocysteine-containing dehydrogenase
VSSAHRAEAGTDGAFALGMMHVLITENLLDHDYIANHTVGFEALKARALSYRPNASPKFAGSTRRN